MKKISHKRCLICKSNKWVRGIKQNKPYCSRHYQQKNNGLIGKRTIYDLNEIVCYKDYCEVVLYNKNCEEIGRTKVSKEHIEKVKKHKWTFGSGYPATWIDGVYIKLHSLIKGKKKGLEIDHVNGNTLDNRNENLRFVTCSQNQQNKKSLGVSYSKHQRKWVAYISKNYKRVHLGYFSSFAEARKERVEAEKKYYGEYRYHGNTKNEVFS